LSDRPRCSICGSDRTEQWGIPKDVSIRQCHSCGARFSCPVPPATILRERYERDYQTAKCGEPAHGIEIERRARLLTRLAGPVPGKLLDVGCGDGRFLDAARRLGWTTFALDIAYGAVSLTSPIHLRLVAELDGIREQPLFDAITFWDVLEHIEEPARALRQARASLREGGLVAVTMPNLRSTTSLFSGTRWPYYDFAKYGHVHHLAPVHIRSLLSTTGFVPVYQETKGSVDLRALPTMYGFGPQPTPIVWFLDKASGLLARIAAPLGFGNILLVVGKGLESPRRRGSSFR
jgi:SAM-dependent methyltransferase